MASPLPLRLQGLLRTEPDQELAGRLTRIFEAAARTVDRLRALDGFDAAEPEGGADLGLFERVAPAVSHTLAEVSGLSQTLRLLFPGDEPQAGPRRSRCDGIARAAAAHLQAEAASFGEQMRNPAVASDAWELLQQVQAHRHRFRETIGALVYDLATVTGDCRREEVEPGYLEALDQALRLRVATTEFRWLLQRRLESVRAALPEDVDWNLEQLKKELSDFKQGVTWKGLRAYDRRHLAELFARVDALPRTGLRQAQLLEAVEPLSAFAERFQALSRRALLEGHDREVLAACGVLLERASTFAQSQPELAQRALAEAAGRATALYGRAEALDRLLFLVQTRPPAKDQVAAATEQFVRALAAAAGAA